MLRQGARTIGPVVSIAVAVVFIAGCGADQDADPSPSTTFPASSATATGATPAGAESYAVRAGDSIIAIARRYCVDADELAGHNDWPEGINHPIYPGDLIEIPEHACAPSAGSSNSGVPRTPAPDVVAALGMPSATQPAGNEAASSATGSNEPYAPYDWPLEDTAWYAPFWAPGVTTDDYDRYFGDDDECETLWEAFVSPRQLDVAVDSADFVAALGAVTSDPPAEVLAAIAPFFDTLDASKPAWRTLYPRLEGNFDSFAFDPEYIAAWAPLDTPEFRTAYYGLYGYLEYVVCPFPWDHSASVSTPTVPATEPVPVSSPTSVSSSAGPTPTPTTPPAEVESPTTDPSAATIGAGS